MFINIIHKFIIMGFWSSIWSFFSKIFEIIKSTRLSEEGDELRDYERSENLTKKEMRMEGKEKISLKRKNYLNIGGLMI